MTTNEIAALRAEVERLKADAAKGCGADCHECDELPSLRAALDTATRALREISQSSLLQFRDIAASAIAEIEKKEKGR